MASSSFPNSIGADFNCQMMTTWSSDPLAKNNPFGENLTTLTVLECPPYKSYKYFGSTLNYAG